MRLLELISTIVASLVVWAGVIVAAVVLTMLVFGVAALMGA
jgi:hypothetical protein